MHLEPNCPHCGQPAYTDEGPYTDDATEERECECGKSYLLTSSVSIDWRTKCLPEDHDYEIDIYNGGMRAECRLCEEMAFAKYPAINDEYVTAAFEKHRETLVCQGHAHE